MGKNELTVIQFSGVVNNVNLQKKLTKINTAIVKSQKSSWEIAEAVNEILTEELYSEDFEKEQDFADFLGISRSNLNKMKRAVDLKKKHELTNDWTLTKVFEMLTVKDDEFDDFIDSYAVVPSMKVAEIRDCVKCWNGCGIEEKTDSGAEEAVTNSYENMEEEHSEEYSEEAGTKKEGKTLNISLYVNGEAICSDCEVTSVVLDKILTLLHSPHSIVY